MGWIFLASTLLFCLCAAGLPLPQGRGGVVGGRGGAAGGHGQPQAGSPSTPGPGGGTAGSGASSNFGAAGGSAPGPGTSAAVGFGVTGGSTGGGAGGGAAAGGDPNWSTGPARRGRGWTDWRRGDPTLIKGLWKFKGPLDSLGKAEVYIFLALLIGFMTVVVGCWLSDNCWSPEPEGVVTLA